MWDHAGQSTHTFAEDDEDEEDEEEEGDNNADDDDEEEDAGRGENGVGSVEESVKHGGNT